MFSLTNPIDRLIVHQFDPSRSSPGGIDTCIRGILRYATTNQTIAVAGVDTGNGPSTRRLGEWETHDFGGGEFFFIPVARLDPADQRRQIPHSLRLMAGVTRYRGRLPQVRFIQAHRADTAKALRPLVRGDLTYFIHTQEAGLTGKTSDSFWRRAGSIHHLLERSVAQKADRVAVFNPEYISTVLEWNSNAEAFATWFDPAVTRPPGSIARRQKSVLWVGRLETPKDPHLALTAFQELHAQDPEWTLDFVGSGTLLSSLKRSAASIGSSVRVHGRLDPLAVAELMGSSEVFLMTSHPGYEGFPRVLVESMASGTAPVVTEGSDTGSLVTAGVNGYVTDRDPAAIAQSVQLAHTLSRAKIVATVEHLSAPAVIKSLYLSDRVA